MPLQEQQVISLKHLLDWNSNTVEASVPTSDSSLTPTVPKANDARGDDNLVHETKIDHGSWA